MRGACGTTVTGGWSTATAGWSSGRPRPAGLGAGPTRSWSMTADPDRAETRERAELRELELRGGMGPVRHGPTGRILSVR
jgi:hypothetical protein